MPQAKVWAFMTTPKYDHALVRYLLILVGMTLVALIAAEYLTDGDSGPLTALIIAAVTPVVSALVLIVRGGEFAKEAQETAKVIDIKTDVQTAKLDKIEGAVNGKMEGRFRRLEESVGELRALIEERLPPPRPSD